MLSVPYSRYVIYPIPWYSFLIVIGASAAIFLASREAVRKGLSSDVIVDLALWILPAGIIGARLYYVIFSWHQFRNDLVSILRIWERSLVKTLGAGMECYPHTKQEDGSAGLEQREQEGEEQVKGQRSWARQILRNC